MFLNFDPLNHHNYQYLISLWQWEHNSLEVPSKGQERLSAYRGSGLHNVSHLVTEVEDGNRCLVQAEEPAYDSRQPGSRCCSNPLAHLKSKFVPYRSVKVAVVTLVDRSDQETAKRFGSEFGAVYWTVGTYRKVTVTFCTQEWFVSHPRPPGGYPSSTALPLACDIPADDRLHDQLGHFPGGGLYFEDEWGAKFPRNWTPENGDWNPVS